MYYSRLCAILWNCQDTFVSIRTGKRAFKLRLECLFLRSQYLHVNFSTLHVVCQYVSKIISKFQKFCRIFLSERKMCTLIFSVYACVRWNWPKLRKKYFFSEWISFRKKNEYAEFQGEYAWDAFYYQWDDKWDDEYKVEMTQFSHLGRWDDWDDEFD